MELSKNTKKTKFQEKIAKSVVYFFVFLTLAILAWIIAYILFRGFIYRNEVSYQFLNIKETNIRTLDYPDVEFLFFVNKNVRVKDLTLEQLRKLYTKKIKENWGDYTGQNLYVKAAYLTEIGSYAKAAKQFLLGSEGKYSRYAKQISTSNKIIEYVASTPGGIGYIQSKNAHLLKNKNVKIVPIRRMSVIVNKSVRKIIDNKQIQELTTDQISEIFTGKIENWQEVGGINLPVWPIIITNDPVYLSIFNSVVKKSAKLNTRVKIVNRLEELIKEIETREGTVGLCYYNDIDINNDEFFEVMEINRIEAGLNLTWHYLVEAPARSGKWGGISTIIINTFFLIIFTLLFSTPIGVLAAIYFVEYSKQTRWIYILRMGTETLAGIPSIVFGLFGFIFFVSICGMGIGFISATLSVTMMVLPTIIRTSEEALKAVPMSYREGSLALGATKFETIMKVVIPAASPGILTGVILAVGRTVGETAVLIYTLGSNYELVRGPSSSARVLSLHLYSMFSEAISFDRSFATGAILIIIVLLVNYSTTKLIGRLQKMAGS